jgi:hypothetical protein
MKASFTASYFISERKSNNLFYIEQRATAKTKTGISSYYGRDYGVAEAPPGFQAGWSGCMFSFPLFFFRFLCLSD